jgi:hypothetical protein
MIKASTIILIVLCSIAVLLWLFQLIKTLRFCNRFSEFKTVEAKVVKLGREKEGYPVATVEYLFRDNKKGYKATAQYVPPKGEEDIRRGDRIKMKWDPQHPRRLYKLDRDHLEKIKLVAFSIMMVSILFCVIITMRIAW